MTIRIDYEAIYRALAEHYRRTKPELMPVLATWYMMATMPIPTPPASMARTLILAEYMKIKSAEVKP
jgi:hypothetical protein